MESSGMTIVTAGSPCALIGVIPGFLAGVRGVELSRTLQLDWGTARALACCGRTMELELELEVEVELGWAASRPVLAVRGRRVESPPFG